MKPFSKRLHKLKHIWRSQVNIKAYKAPSRDIFDTDSDLNSSSGIHLATLPAMLIQSATLKFRIVYTCKLLLALCLGYLVYV